VEAKPIFDMSVETGSVMNPGDGRNVCIPYQDQPNREAARIAFARRGEAFGELDSPPSLHQLELWVERYFCYLDRNGAFVTVLAATAELPWRTVNAPP
jgi:hypothetical protein